MKNSGALCKISDCKISFFYIFKPEELENKWFRKNCKFSTQLFHWNNAFEAYWIGKIRALELCIACVLLLKKSATSREAEMHWYFDISHDSWPWPWTTKNCAYAELILSKFFMYNLSINHHPSEHIISLWPVSEGPILQIILSPRPQKRPFPPRAPAAPL